MTGPLRWRRCHPKRVRASGRAEEFMRQWNVPAGGGLRACATKRPACHSERSGRALFPRTVWRSALPRSRRIPLSLRCHPEAVRLGRMRLWGAKRPVLRAKVPAANVMVIRSFAALKKAIRSFRASTQSSRRFWRITKIEGSAFAFAGAPPSEGGNGLCSPARGGIYRGPQRAGLACVGVVSRPWGICVSYLLWRQNEKSR